ncbi:hypothetical protein R50073_08580 [Maricurvus nonylphenolicus]
MKADLSLTDSQLGMLALTFGIFHAAMAVPIGRLADTRFSRKSVLTACLGIWSAATAVCGVATNFVQLLIARLGVGGATAGYAPTAFSLVSDKFPIHKRSFAIAICMSGMTIGMILSMVAGGALAEAVGWRMTFILVGVPGILLVPLLMYTIQAPERGHADGIEEANEMGFSASMKYLMATPSFIFVVLGGAIKAVAFNGIIQWIPSFYIRKFDLTVGEVGMALGPILGVCMLSSILLSSFIADKMGQKDLRWHPWIISITLLLNFPFIYFAFAVDSYYLSLVCYAGATLMGTAMMGINNSMIQNAVPVQVRGTATAIKTAMLGLFGWGIGGAIVGVLSDSFGAQGSAEGLQTALIYVSLGLPIACVAFFLSSRSYAKDCEKAKQASVA